MKSNSRQPERPPTLLVTGGTRGIGAAIAELARASGARVLVQGRPPRGSDASKREDFWPADLELPGSASSLWAQVRASGLEVDVVVNNAGIYEPQALEDDDAAWAESWARTLQVNLVAAAELSRAAVRTWLERGRGGILINIASRAAWRGDGPDYGAYAASKAGLVALTKTLARAYADRGIYAYAVAPGFVRTEMAAQAFAAEAGLEARVRAEIPLGDIIPPVEVARTVWFLASGGVSHATGSTFDLTGASYVR